MLLTLSTSNSLPDARTRSKRSAILLCISKHIPESKPQLRHNRLLVPTRSRSRLKRLVITSLIDVVRRCDLLLLPLAELVSYSWHNILTQLYEALNVCSQESTHKPLNRSSE